MKQSELVVALVSSGNWLLPTFSECPSHVVPGVFCRSRYLVVFHRDDERFLEVLGGGLVNQRDPSARV